MNTIEILPSIRESYFDASRNRSDASSYWRIGSEARDIRTLNGTQNYIQTASNKVERASALPENASTVIGGLCSIFTGDLTSERLRNEASKLVRMDQIVESVGNVRGKSTFVIFEDSFFESLTGISRTQFQIQAQEAATCISRWLRLSTGQSPDLRTAFTSDLSIETQLQETVQLMATDILGQKRFADIQAAPVLMMYTSYWSEILSAAGVIDSPNAICVEPTLHFIDDRKLPTPLTGAYESFLNWIRNNPYGVPDSANSSYGIAGFLESYSSDMQKKRTRLMPYTQVPNSENVMLWTAKLKESQELFPFPLKNSAIFAEAVNWGLWNEDISEALLQLISMENQYYAEKKKLTPSSSSDVTELQRLARLQKDAYLTITTPIVTFLAEQTSNILLYVLKGSI